MKLLQRWLTGLLLIIGLAGCQVELYSNLSEKEGNEMLAVLLSHDIPATKIRGKEFISITVDQDKVASAIETLQRNGLPRDRYTDLGQIFQKQGLISSPLEERVRYTYGLGQMISEMLNQIDGVLTARVLIVLPEEAQYGRESKPSSSSVFIKYRPGLGVEEAIPKIKMVMQNSVQGLNYDNITVVLFPAQEIQRLAEIAPPSSQESSLSTIGWYAALGGLLLAVAGNAYLIWRMRRAKPAADHGEMAGG